MPTMDKNEKNWRTVFKAQGMHEAAIVNGRLETEGIPVRLRYESAGPIYAITVDGLGEVQIMVPDDQFEEARRVLMNIYRDEEIPWKGEPA